MSKVELVKASVIALDPKKFYMVVFDNKDITVADARIVGKELKRQNIESIEIVLRKGGKLQEVDKK